MFRRSYETPAVRNRSLTPPPPDEHSRPRSRANTEDSFDSTDLLLDHGETTSHHGEQHHGTVTTSKKVMKKQSASSRCTQKVNGKKIVMMIVSLFFLVVMYESFFVDPDDRLLQPDFGDRFLGWVQSNPTLGLGAISIVLAGGVVTMVPIGTPLTIGCGYIYRGVYGWRLGLFVATAVSMAGSCLGACICFLLARYLMRETVQRWVRKYPLFDAIDIASREQGLKIMAMLYLTPVLPLGLVSYACGTTSMKLGAFAAAKIAATPLYLVYTFIGASAHSFIKKGGSTDTAGDGVGISTEQQAKELEENQLMIVGGIVLSVVMMTLITRHIRNELMKILDQQKKDKPSTEEGSESYSNGANGDEVDTIEMGLTTRRRGHKSEAD